jgi:hypothetical protein
VYDDLSHGPDWLAGAIRNVGFDNRLSGLRLDDRLLPAFLLQIQPAGYWAQLKLGLLTAVGRGMPEAPPVNPHHPPPLAVGSAFICRPQFDFLYPIVRGPRVNPNAADPQDKTVRFRRRRPSKEDWRNRIGKKLSRLRERGKPIPTAAQLVKACRFKDPPEISAVNKWIKEWLAREITSA